MFVVVMSIAEGPLNDNDCMGAWPKRGLVAVMAQIIAISEVFFMGCRWSSFCPPSSNWAFGAESRSASERKASLRRAQTAATEELFPR